jgi:hypothetical protein
MSCRTHCRIALPLILLSSLTARLDAATDNWSTASSNFWDVGPWSLGHQPNATDGALFNSLAIYEVRFDSTTGDRTINDLQVNGGNVLFYTSGGPTRTLHVTDASDQRRLVVNNATAGLGFKDATSPIVFDIGGLVLVTDNGSLNVTNDADILAGSNISIGTGFFSNTATLSIQDTGSNITQSGGGVVYVGTFGATAASVNIGTATSGGKLTTGTGGLSIFPSGAVNVGSPTTTGQLVLNGDLTINGGLLQLTNQLGQNLTVPSGKTVNIQNGGRFNSGTFFPSNDINCTYNITTNAQVVSNFGVDVSNNSTMNVESGATVSGANIDFSNGAAVVVDGLETTLAGTATQPSRFGGPLGAATNVTFRNQATGSFTSGLHIAKATDEATQQFDGAAATVNVLSGATIQTGLLTLASYGGINSVASLNINGPGSAVTQSNTSDMFVGDASAGSAAINIGTVNSGGTLTAGAGPNGLTVRNTGSITIGKGSNSGTLNAAGNMNINGGAVYLLNGTIDANTINFNAGTFNFSGTLHVSKFNGDLAQDAGTLAPGHSAGTTTVNGNYTLKDGTLQIELGGLVQGTSFDFVDVNGTAFLGAGSGGTLQVIFLSGFTPAAGNSFDILDWDNRVGTFRNVLLPALSTGLMWNAAQLYSAGTLRITLAGDYNANGVVDAADYSIWRKTLGQSGTALAADGNANGQIDAGDLAVWRAHFGQTAGSGAGAGANAAVPEPATLVMLVLAAAGVCPRRRRTAYKFPNTHQRVTHVI